MRIVLSASSFLPRIGGVEEHVSSVAHELARRGHDVTVWAVDQGDRTPSHDGPIPLRYLAAPLPNRSLRGMLNWLMAAPRAWWTWFAASRRDRPDVIIVQCFGPNGPYASALARWTKTPLVYSNHGETFMDADGVFDRSAVLRGALRRALSASAAVLSCSEFAAADLARFGLATPPVVVGNGIDLDLSGAPVQESLPRRYVAGVGRLVAVKGFDRLLRAFAGVRDDPRMHGVDLVIVGSGEQGHFLGELARKLEIADRVHFLGNRSRPEVRTILDDALVQVVPSAVEAFGIVVLEGWRSGVPVIVTDRGGPPEYVADGVNGLLFDPEDVVELSRLLAAVVADPADRRRLGEAGRESARRFSWRAVADSYERVLEGVARRSARETR